MVITGQHQASKRWALLRWVSWYLFGTVCFLVLASTGLLSSAPTAFADVQLIYLVAALLGHFASLAGLLWLFLIAPIVLVLPLARLIKPLVVVISVLALLVLIIDVQVFALYRFHINGILLKLAVQDRGREIFVFSAREWMSAGFVVVGVLAAQALLSVVVRNHTQKLQGKVPWGVLASVLVFLSFVGSHVTHAWSDARYNRSITSLTRYIPLYRPATAKLFLQRQGWIDVEAVRQGSQQQSFPVALEVAGGLDYPKAALQCTAEKDSLNVLTIVIDSWRADELDAIASPFLMALSKGLQTLNFTEHFSGGNSTQAGIFSLFYGLPSLYWQTMADTATAPVLMDTLQSSDYEIGVFASAVLTHPAFDRTVFSGVDKLRLASEGEVPWQRDESVNADWSAFLSERDTSKPFFGFLFYDSAHGYSYPDTHQGPYSNVWQRIDRTKLDNDFDPAPYANKHKTAVHYVDGLIRQVIEDLKRRGLYDKTLIVVTSDHGEEFNDNGLNFWGHGSNYTRPQLQVPFFVHWPGQQGREFTHRTNHMDMAPTLLSELLGCENPPMDYSQGQNMLEQKSWSWMVAGSYYNQAVLFENSILVTYPTGNYEVLTPGYRVSGSSDLSPELLNEVLTEMYQFIQ